MFLCLNFHGNSWNTELYFVFGKLWKLFGQVWKDINLKCSRGMPKACVKTYLLKDLARQRSAAELEHAKPAWTRYLNAMNAQVCGFATCV
jgi:hypothetical protein